MKESIHNDIETQSFRTDCEVHTLQFTIKTEGLERKCKNELNERIIRRTEKKRLYFRQFNYSTDKLF